MLRRIRQQNLSSDGFTLTEVLIALVIVALISAIAMPMYTRYSLRGYRTEAQADLLMCAQGLERMGAINFTYAGAIDSDGDGQGDTDTGVVSANLCIPTTRNYSLSVQSADDLSFVVRATPDASSPAMNDGRMEIDSDGSRRWDHNNDNDFGDSGEDQWQEQ